MNKKYIVLSLTLFIAVVALVIQNDKSDEFSDVKALKEKHEEALKNSPFKNNRNLSKTQRREMGLPPNAYFEQIWELSLDPSTGRPMPERLLDVQMKLRKDWASNKGVGGDASNPWIERGPDLVSTSFTSDSQGRTRAIMFDPNDVGAGNGDGIDYNRVFAGNVAGGLWVNNDITSSSSTWSLVTGFPNNAAITEIIYDPNNTNTFYIGTGESYGGAVVQGNGIWKSTDGGVNWTNIFGGYSDDGSGGQLINGVFQINDLLARDIGSTTELYAAVAGSSLSGSSNPTNFLGLQEQGIYKSTNNGTTWAKLTDPDLLESTSNGTQPINPNDLELDINNNIWLATTRNLWGANGGKILQSTDGTNFTLVNTISNALRTEIEPSQTNANTFWALIRSAANGEVDIYTTTNAFSTITPITTEPNDTDPGIPSTDFTRNQAFYDLEIEADASGNLIVGGINLFRSTDNGATWPQISKWFSTQTGNFSLVHPDQHAIVQRPGTGNSNKYAFGHDGGISYSDDITLAPSSTTNINQRNQDYNTIQFYYGAIDPVDGGDGDDLAGGTQDNGTPLIIDAAAGANTFTDLFSGDGGFTEFDDSGLYMIQSYVYNDHRYVNYPTLTTGFTFTTVGPNNNPNGDFINQAVLDKNLNILYSNASNSSQNRIERVTEFIPGAPAQTQTFINNAALNDRPSAFAVSPYTTTSTKLFIGTRNSKLLRVDSADTGVSPTFTDISGAGFVGSVSDIEFGQSESEIFVTMHNYGVTSVWYTNNGGTTWVGKEGDLPDIPVRCILQNPLIPAEVIIGTDLGVWYTGNIQAASPTWQQANNGMREVRVVDLDVRTSDNVILASTFGRGMFTSQFTSSPLSIDDQIFDEASVSIIPTVSDGRFEIFSKRALGEISFKLFDLTGKMVYDTSFDMNGPRKAFDLSLQDGLYIAKIESDISTVTKRIIIR